MSKVDVETPKGVITVETNEADIYPGVKVFIDGNPVAMIEYNPATDTHRAVVWVQDKDEPEAIIELDKK